MEAVCSSETSASTPADCTVIVNCKIKWACSIRKLLVLTVSAVLSFFVIFISLWANIGDANKPQPPFSNADTFSTYLIHVLKDEVHWLIFLRILQGPGANLCPVKVSCFLYSGPGFAVLLFHAMQRIQNQSVFK
jgi:hypothetical protein